MARKTYGFSGAMLADLLNEAAILAARRGAETIGPEDLHAGWLKVAVGTSRRRSMDERERSIIAAHEVGHAICGKVHGDKRRVEEISLFAHGEALGVTVSSQEDNDLPSESDLRARLVALMGGRAAEEILFHEVTGGASNDFETANQIATTMVTKWGMGRDPEANDDGISGRGSLSFLVPTGERSLPSEVQAAATRAIRAILDEAYAEACRDARSRNIGTLRRLAAYLVEHERVDGDDVRRAVRRPASRPEGRRRVAGRDVAAARLGRRRGPRGTAAQRGDQPAALPVAAVANAAPIAPAPDDGSVEVAATSPAAALEAPQAAVSSVATASVASLEARPGESGVDEAFSAPAADAGADDPSVAAAVVTRPRARRRTVVRKARKTAAGLLRRAERWVRAGELEADRL